MSKWDKLLYRILNLSNEIRFDELRKILEYYGYTMYSPRGGSSHYTFRKIGNTPITKTWTNQKNICKKSKRSHFKGGKPQWTS